MTITEIEPLIDVMRTRKEISHVKIFNYEDRDVVALGVPKLKKALLFNVQPETARGYIAMADDMIEKALAAS